MTFDLKWKIFQKMPLDVKNVFQRGTAIYEMSSICIESVDSYRVETSIVLFAINETDKI